MSLSNGNQLKNILVLTALSLAPLPAAHAVEFHVATIGKDSNPDTQAAPFRTIQRAADLAQPGDVVMVHEGIYRERINPPRGGESDSKRIVYQAAPGEKVEIKGSEVIKNWVKVQDNVWKVTLPNSARKGAPPVHRPGRSRTPEPARSCLKSGNEKRLP